MKKIISLIMTGVLLLSSATMSFAQEKHNGHQNAKHQEERKSEERHAYKLDPNKIPYSKIVVDLGATVSYDKATSVLTVVKGTNTVIVNYKSQTVTLNGAAVTDSGILTSKNEEKMTECLLKYLKKVIDGKNNNNNPVLAAPTNVTVVPEGGTVIANTLNSSTVDMNVTANITAGQATGGKAELYVGSKLIATDSAIAATDTSVTFTTSDGTPTNAELQAIVPAGGAVSVKLYNASNQSVTSSVGNPTLVVDYAAPTITGVLSAVYYPASNQLLINVTGVGAIGDKVDVTKLSLIDTALAKTCQLTNTSGTGSTGVVSSANSLLVTIGSADKLALAGFGTSTMTLIVSAGSLLSDTAGNTSISLTTTSVPVSILNQ